MTAVYTGQWPHHAVSGCVYRIPVQLGCNVIPDCRGCELRYLRDAVENGFGQFDRGLCPDHPREGGSGQVSLLDLSDELWRDPVPLEVCRELVIAHILNPSLRDG